jgi:hypothetical protein
MGRSGERSSRMAAVTMVEEEEEAVVGAPPGCVEDVLFMVESWRLYGEEVPFDGSGAGS